MVVAVLIAAVFLGGGFVAGRSLVTSAAPSDVQQTEIVYYETRQGSIERSLNFTARAAWDQVGLAPAGLDGTVTTARIAPSAPILVDNGETLFTVNLIPVFMFTGSVPSFRDLSLRTFGPDVAQLQEGLNSLGYEAGSPDGRFDQTLLSAVKAWQKDQGLEQSGSILRGQIQFIPALPRLISLDSAMTVGSTVGAATPAIEGFAGAPNFVIPLALDQRDVVPAGAQVQITGPNGEAWVGRVERAVEEAADGGSLQLRLAGSDGGSICGAACTSIPVEDSTNLPAVVTIVPPVYGTVVPSAAVLTDAVGSTVVIARDGSRLPITVIASDQGRTVVDGLEDGVEIRAVVE